MKLPLTLTTVIHVGPCQIHVIGHRSRKGWNITFNSKFQGERKHKKDAIQLAEDACEPGVKGTFKVEPREA